MGKKKLVGIAAMLLIVGAFGFVPAHAAPSTGCTTSDGSATNWHVEDDSTDYQAVLGGDQTFGFGDVNGAANDILLAWVNGPTGLPGTKWGTASVQVGALAGTEINEEVFVVWERPDPTHPAGTKSIRFVSATAGRPGVWSYAYGYVDQTVGNLYTSEGSTTGSADDATGIITIQIPKAMMVTSTPPAPDEGTLASLKVETYMLVGSSLVGGSLQPEDTAEGPCLSLTIA